MTMRRDCEEMTKICARDREKGIERVREEDIKTSSVE